MFGIVAACSSTANPSTTHDADVTPECAVVTARRVVADFRGLCPEGAIRVRNAGEWAAFVARCVTGGHDGLPDIDWQREEVVGRTQQLWCPFDGGGPIVFGAETCGRTLVSHVWTWRDWCWCDYTALEVALYVVARDTIDEVVMEEVDEADCAAVRCDCPDQGGPTPGCDAYSRCSTDWENYPPVDGRPPTWPSPDLPR